MPEGARSIQPSPELKAVMTRLLKAAEGHDVETIRSLIDVADHTLVIGSDPQEWHLGPASVDLLTLATTHSRTYRYDIRRLEAFEAGPFGWAAADTVVQFDPVDEAEGQLRNEPVQLRIVAVFTLDQGSWRVTLWNASVPTPDDPDVVGAELSETVTAMIKSLEGEAEISALTSRLQTATVSLVFTDIVDSTALAANAGDIAWGETITEHLAEVGRIAASGDGVVVKTTGDGAMLAFGSARRAVEAAAKLAKMTGGDERLRLRIGVHTGEAVKTDVDYFGQTVNEAARIMATAQPEQVLVSDVTRSLVGEVDGIEFGGPITVELKGIPGVRQVHPIE